MSSKSKKRKVKSGRLKPTSPDKPLTKTEQAFLNEYIKDFNGRRAYQATYKRCKSENAARVEASRLLAKPNVAAELGRSLERLQERAELDTGEIIQEMKKLAFANQQDYTGFGPNGVKLKDSDSLTRDQMAAISEVREVGAGRHKNLQLKLHDKKGALDSLARWAGIEKMPKPPDEPLRIEIVGDMSFSEIRKRRQK